MFITIAFYLILQTDQAQDILRSYMAEDLTSIYQGTLGYGFILLLTITIWINSRFLLDIYGKQNSVVSTFFPRLLASCLLNAFGISLFKIALAPTFINRPMVNQPDNLTNIPYAYSHSYMLRGAP